MFYWFWILPTSAWQPNLHPFPVPLSLLQALLSKSPANNVTNPPGVGESCRAGKIELFGYDPPPPLVWHRAWQKHVCLPAGWPICPYLHLFEAFLTWFRANPGASQLGGVHPALFSCRRDPPPPHSAVAGRTTGGRRGGKAPSNHTPASSPAPPTPSHPPQCRPASRGSRPSSTASRTSRCTPACTPTTTRRPLT